MADNYGRALTPKLKKWKDQKERKPLVIKGARQVGKTFLIRKWGQSEFKKIHEFNFQKDQNLKKLFLDTQSPKKLIERLEIFSETKININEDLIFFDEIQDCPQALNSLKFFCEDLPQAYIINAGSLLGIHLSNYPFPVGKVDFLNLYPFSFQEFLIATQKENLANQLIHNSDHLVSLHDNYLESLKKYYILGGMPEVIQCFNVTGDFQASRIVQKNLLETYKNDFLKYSGSVDAIRILQVFESIPKQLARDQKKFQFKELKTGARYAEFSAAIQWLIAAGLCHKVNLIDTVEIPLKSLIQENSFKLYFFDTGLLGALAELSPATFLLNEDLFKTFKGSFAENFFAQEFVAHFQKSIYCWQNQTSEVDFVFEHNNEIYPIEIKSGTSGHFRSLNIFKAKYEPKKVIKSTLQPYLDSSENKVLNLPLYAVNILIDELFLA